MRRAAPAGPTTPARGRRRRRRYRSTGPSPPVVPDQGGWRRCGRRRRRGNPTAAARPPAPRAQWSARRRAPVPPRPPAAHSRRTQDPGCRHTVELLGGQAVAHRRRVDAGQVEQRGREVGDVGVLAADAVVSRAARQSGRPRQHERHPHPAGERLAHVEPERRVRRLTPAARVVHAEACGSDELDVVRDVADPTGRVDAGELREVASVPSDPPSAVPPLSEVNTTIVLSSSPSAATVSRMRPRLWSMLSTIAAYTSM